MRRQRAVAEHEQEEEQSDPVWRVAVHLYSQRGGTTARSTADPSSGGMGMRLSSARSRLISTARNRSSRTMRCRAHGSTRRKMTASTAGNDHVRDRPGGGHVRHPDPAGAQCLDRHGTGLPQPMPTQEQERRAQRVQVAERVQRPRPRARGRRSPRRSATNAWLNSWNAIPATRPSRSPRRAGGSERRKITPQAISGSSVPRRWSSWGRRSRPSR